MLTDVPTRTVRIDTTQLTAGQGFANVQGQFVAFSPDRLLYHELVHATQGTDDAGWLDFLGAPQWDLLYEPDVDLKGATVEKENAFSVLFEPSPGTSLIRPSYLSAGSAQDLYNNGNSFTKTADGTVVIVDHVAVDVGSQNSISTFRSSAIQNN